MPNQDERRVSKMLWSIVSKAATFGHTHGFHVSSERAMQERGQSEQNETVAQNTPDEVGNEKRWRLIIDSEETVSGRTKKR